ncbi:MAG: hypothetical protein HLUCCO18_11000 [Rhodobacteraceae bacterium HLUCCO18]|nr:MAG: hypothetical protein HLUCCO18_11000 [Rhodobacteraceae bacterium HLUCCO18]
MARRVFLERRTYRKNRLQDAARLLPVLGMILFFGPVFIVEDTSGQAGAGMAEWLVYCFAVWVVLIAVTALVNRALADGDTQPPRDPSAPAADRRA